MSSIVDYLQSRIEETKRDLQAATNRMQQATAERDMLAAELQGYEKTLSAEMRRAGIAPAIPVLPPEQRESEEDETNKAGFALRYIREHADSGTTPAAIFRSFEQARIPIKKAYIYSLVQRFQKRGLIRSRRGRWYPEPPPNIGTKQLEMVQ